MFQLFFQFHPEGYLEVMLNLYFQALTCLFLIADNGWVFMQAG